MKRTRVARGQSARKRPQKLGESIKWLRGQDWIEESRSTRWLMDDVCPTASDPPRHTRDESLSIEIRRLDNKPSYNCESRTNKATRTGHGSIAFEHWQWPLLGPLRTGHWHGSPFPSHRPIQTSGHRSAMLRRGRPMASQPFTSATESFDIHFCAARP